MSFLSTGIFVTLRQVLSVKRYLQSSEMEKVIFATFPTAPAADVKCKDVMGESKKMCLIHCKA